jgi:hypothetical protein
VVTAAADAAAVVATGPAVATVMTVVQAARIVARFTDAAAPVPHPSHHGEEQH